MSGLRAVDAPGDLSRVREGQPHTDISWEMRYEEALAYLGEAFTILCATEDAQEGVSAFLTKRTAEWKER